jgi:hypothetical protein
MTSPINNHNESGINVTYLSKISKLTGTYGAIHFGRRQQKSRLATAFCFFFAAAHPFQTAAGLAFARPAGLVIR